MKPIVELNLRLISNIAFNMKQGPSGESAEAQFAVVQTLAETALRDGGPLSDLIVEEAPKPQLA